MADDQDANVNDLVLQMRNLMQGMADQQREMVEMRNLMQEMADRRNDRRDDDEREEDRRDRRRGPRRERGPNNEEDDDLTTIKNNIPTFKGKNDPEAYLEWERKVDLLFECHHYSEEKKVKLVTIEFSDYALIWWDQQLKGIRRYGGRPVDNWDDLKEIMRKRFILSFYFRDLYQKLQGLKQGNRSVEEYHKDLEVAMIRADIDEPEQATMARFLYGLNKEIVDRVDLQNCEDLKSMFHTTVKVEGQLREKGKSFQKSREWSSPKPNFGNTSNSPNEVSNSKFKLDSSKFKPPNEVTNATRNRDVKCFRCLGVGHIASNCPNKRIMIVRPNGDIESKSEKEEKEGEENEPKEAIPEHGELLVVQRALNTHLKEDEQQRENIFHARCEMQGKVCMLIVDGGSSTNIASLEMVEKKKSESGEKKRVGKIPQNFYMRAREVMRDITQTKRVFFIVYKECFFNSNDLTLSLPKVFVSLLQEFEDIFPFRPSRAPPWIVNLSIPMIRGRIIFEEEGNDEVEPELEDPLIVRKGPITRRLKEALTLILIKLRNQAQDPQDTNKLVNVIQVDGLPFT